MKFPNLDQNLTEEQTMIHETAVKFVAEVVRPIGIEVDKIADPEEAIAKSSPLWDAIRQYRELGFHKAGIPEALGGLGGEDPMAELLMIEAVSHGDTGLQGTLDATAAIYNIAAMFGDEEMQGWAKAFCDDTSGEISGCWAITEPNHGTDWISSIDSDYRDLKVSPDLKAKLHGDEYIFTGQKSSWVSNGRLATHAAIHVSLDDSQGMQGTGLAIIPLDLPGISKGKALDKIGLRGLNQGEIFFDEVKIPKKMMIVPDPAAMAGGMFKQLLSLANTSMCQKFSGLALAAFEEALTYAVERVQGGVPIIEHQNIQLKIFTMFRQVEAARSMTRRTVMYNATNEVPSMVHAAAAKIQATKAAFDVASEAVQVFGGNGLSKEYVVEKLFRDARAGLIMDGTNESLAISATHLL